MRVDPEQLNQLLRPIFSPASKRAAMAEQRVVAKGLAAGPGAATGKVVFNAPDAEAWAMRGEKVLLVRIETSPEDIRGMDAAQGILTARGGMTCHAALVARQMGKVCVVGCEALDIDYVARTMKVDGHTVQGGRLGLHRRLHRRGHRGPARDAARRGAPGPDREVAGAGRLVDLRLLRAHDGVGGRAAEAARPRQRRPARPGGQRRRVRRPGHRPLPHRAHVLRRRPHHRRARDDHQRERRSRPARTSREPRAQARRQSRRQAGGERARQGARRGRRQQGRGRLSARPRQARADAARRLRRHLPRHGRASGHDPHARPAAARVPAARRQGAGRGRTRDGRRRVGDRRQGRGAARVQPHARPPRLPARRRLSRDHPDAGPGDPRGGLHRQEGRRRRAARDHDPARRHPQGARGPGAQGARDGGAGVRRAGSGGRLPGRHHDRDPARRADRRRDRRASPSSSASAPTTSPR